MKLTTLALATATATLAVPAIAEDIVLSIGSRGYGPAVERDFERFAAEHPDITIEWNKVSDVPGETRELYVNGLTAKSPTPDVFAVDVIWTGEFAQCGWLEPVNGLLSAETIDSFNSSLLSASTLDGAVHALPLYADGIHFFYRADLLEKYGLEMPATWEDVMAASQTITEGEGNPQFYGFVSMWAKIEGLFMNSLAFATFLEHFTAYDQQLAAAVEDNRAPTLPAVYDDPAMASAEVLAKFGKNYAFGVVRRSASTGSNYPKISEIMQLEITNALHQQKSVDEALNDAQAQIEAVLAN